MWIAKDAAGVRARLDEWYPPFAPLPADSAQQSQQTSYVAAHSADPVRHAGDRRAARAAVRRPVSTRSPVADRPSAAVEPPAAVSKQPDFDDETQPAWLRAQSQPSAGPVSRTDPSHDDSPAFRHEPGDRDPSRQPLDYVDDLLAPSKKSATQTKKRGNGVKIAAATALGVVALGAITVAATGARSGGGSDSVAATATESVAAQPPPDWCQEGRTADTVTGAGPGNQQDGPSAILAFDYAYYVERSGAKARAVFEPADPNAVTAQTLQSAIDSAIPAGAEHCLTIRTDPTVPGRYAVELTERHTDGTSITYKQDVTTADRGGKHVITSIGAAE